MESNFKSKSFPFVFWIMIIALLWDTFDTFNRTILGYFKGSIPVTGSISIEPSTLGLILSVIQIIVILYGIYLLFKKKKVGGFFSFYNRAFIGIFFSNLPLYFYLVCYSLFCSNRNTKVLF